MNVATESTSAADDAQRLLIFGSCVSRDALAFSPGSFRLVDYFARCGMGSLACMPLTRRIALEKIESPFQKRMIQRDAAKKFLAAVKEIEFDVLLVDLIDERFSVYTGPEGGCTISTEVQRCEPKIGRWPGTVLRPGTPEFMDLWEQGWEAFIGAVRECGALRKVRVNAVHWSKSRRGGGPFAPRHGPAQIDAANAMLDRMYRRMGADLSDDQFLRFAPEFLVAAENHQWGPSPFHYVEEYYVELMRQLVSATAQETRA